MLANEDTARYYTRWLRDADPEGYDELLLTTGDWVPPVTKARAPRVQKPPSSWALKYPRDAFCYARDTFKGRWLPGETVIAKSSSYAFLYARDVLGGRFPAGEPEIAKDSYYAHEYAEWLKEVDPAGCAKFVASDLYSAHQMDHGDWVPGEVAEAALVLARKRPLS